MKSLRCNIPDSIYSALASRIAADRSNCDIIIAEALSQYLDKPIHTLFQVSTSAALVEGLYQGAVRVAQLLMHGDFGVGTFIDLEGEMVVLDSVCYQICPSGVISTVEADRLIPYAIVTRFDAETSKQMEELASFGDLIATCDAVRKSENVFYAFRVDGDFASVKTRVMNPIHQGAGLKMAASAQAEFLFENIEGTLVGLWSPAFAGSFSVPGYHFHFLSKDRRHGGHVLACHTRRIKIECCSMHEMHVSLPETEEFLRADLSLNPNEDLKSAENEHS